MAAGSLQRLLPEVPQALARLLDPAAGMLAEPIRAEIFGPIRFAQHGRSLGATHRAERPGMLHATFFPRLQDNIRMLRQAHAVIGDQVAAGYDISPAAQWLLDNFHLIDAQLLAIHEGLPRSYFRALPVLLDEPLAGLPRIYGVAWAFVAHTDGALDEDLLVPFLVAYQESRELRLGEMWALPTTLRVVLVENLRRLAERLATHKAAREVANLVCDRLPACSVELLEALRSLLERRGVAVSFLAQMAQRLQEGALEVDAKVPVEVLDWLQAALPNLASVHAQQAMEQTADNLSVSNAVTSLRQIGDTDWPDIVGRTSALMQLMLSSASFAAEHSATRDRTLHVIEHLARRSRRSEIEVAQALLGLMKTPPVSGEAHTSAEAAEAPQAVEATTAAHWLVGGGRDTLHRALGLHADHGLAWQAALRHAALPLYLGAVVLSTLALTAWFLPPDGHSSATGYGAWIGPLVAVLALLPASETAVAVIHRLISESTRPDKLSRLALVDGIPAEHRVMVVIPAMITDAATIDRLVHRLVLHWLANPEQHAQFALLTDWANAATEHAAGDEALLAYAVEQIRMVNARHRMPGNLEQVPRFVLLHRQRTQSRSEQAWIGWERKRGKLEQLVAALATGDHSAFADLGEASLIAAGTRHLVTLDSDTQLPPGRLRELVSVAAHPDNQPRLNAAGTRVVSGYGILQPRIVTPLPARHEDTAFHRLFAGECGIDPYGSASSEVYQDLFGEGSFTGKGLLQVDAVHAVLHGRLPEGWVLSHDLLEGSIARCAAVTDITLIEDAPGHAEVAASRVHRWTRGDWQLLPFLLQPWRWSLGAVNRWKFIDNLRRSLLRPASLALLTVMMVAPGLSPWRALALVFAAFSAGPLLGALASLVPSRSAVARAHFYRQAGVDLVRACGAGLWHLAMLLQHAAAAVDAIARALWRMAISRRRLLQWTTAASAQAAARVDFWWALRRHPLVPPAALLLMAALALAGTPHLALGIALCLLWGGGRRCGAGGRVALCQHRCQPPCASRIARTWACWRVTPGATSNAA